MMKATKVSTRTKHVPTTVNNIKQTSTTPAGQSSSRLLSRRGDSDDDFDFDDLSDTIANRPLNEKYQINRHEGTMQEASQVTRKHARQWLLEEEDDTEVSRRHDKVTVTSANLRQGNDVDDKLLSDENITKPTTYAVSLT